MSVIEHTTEAIQELAIKFELAGQGELFKLLDSAAFQMRMMRGQLEEALPDLEAGMFSNPNIELIEAIKGTLND